MEKENIDRILAQKEGISEVLEIERAVVSKVDAQLDWFWGLTLFHPDEIPYAPDDISKAFTNFQK